MINEVDNPKFIAHTKDGKTFVLEQECQSLVDHLNNVSKKACNFGKDFGAENELGAMGLLHDIGKYKPDFQQRIRGKKISVDHAIYGAVIADKTYGSLGKLLGMAIAGHHTGLKNSGNSTNGEDGSYYARLNKFIGQEICYEKEIQLPKKINHKRLNGESSNSAFSVAVYIKMLFSALVDSDWIDTEEYVTDIKRTPIDYSFEMLYDRLMKSIPQNDGSVINNIRAGILKDCLDKSNEKQGLFTLTVPTGGGKTLSSLAFALSHAKKHNLKRIIYVIPYTSIIEQNADVISKAVGSEYVLEHHSNTELNIEDDKLKREIKWATENWDIPIVITTNVQFFESFFSNRTAKNRKLHNISKSVIIFDEAQMLPTKYLSPCMYAISELITNYKVSALLCSATQPEIHKYKYSKLDVTEIISEPTELAKALQRNKYLILGEKSDEEIISIMGEENQALVILNSRKHAYHIFIDAYQKYGDCVYHLSTLMYPKHRREIINAVKARLLKKLPVYLISTQLIESGVDVDFPVVIRSMAGIDSIIQAGGRANRENKLDCGKVYVFEATSEYGKAPRLIEAYASISKEIIDVYKDRAFELEGIAQYFKLLYSSTNSKGILDQKNILGEYEITGNEIKLNFENVSDNFKLIENDMYSIVIDNDEKSKNVISEIRLGNYSTDNFRKLQQYTVSIYDTEYRRLYADNVIENIDGTILLLNNLNYYNDKTGLNIFTEENLNAESYYIKE